MKLRYAVLLAVLCAVASAHAGDFTNRYPSLTLPDGNTYSNARPQRVSGQNLVLFHSKGIACVPLSSLPTNVISDLDLKRTPVRSPQPVAQSRRTPRPAVAQRFAVKNLIVKKVKGGWLKGQYDYWLDVHNLNATAFSGTLHVQPLNSSTDGIRPAARKFDVAVQARLHKPICMNCSIAPSTIGAHGEYGIRGFSVELKDQNGTTVFRDTVPVTSKFEDTTRYSW